MKKFLFLSMISACICINETDAVTESQNTQDVGLASRGIPSADAQDVNDALETQPGPFAIQPLRVDPTNAVESQTIDNITIISVDLNHANNPANLPNRLKAAKSINLVIKSKIERLSSELFEQFLGKDNVAMLKSKVQSISIPNSVTEIADNCFKGWKNLSTVSFGSSSTLVRVGKEAFARTSIHEIRIPDCVEEICDSCFDECKSLSRVTFGPSSSLKRIGARAFAATSIREIHIPDSVEELWESCFWRCESLSRATFGKKSSLKLIGKKAFSCSGLQEIHIPDSVEELGDACFSWGEIDWPLQSWGPLSRVTFGEASSLKIIGEEAFRQSSITAICIPDGVKELGERCFQFCKSLSRVTFGEASSLKRIGASAFAATTALRGIHIPDGVEELGEGCFSSCRSLSRVTFEEASSLKIIGEEAFYGSGIHAIHIPDSVEEICDRCFYHCKLLSRVTFGEAPSLKLIGKQAFCESFLSEIHLPNSLRKIYDNAFAKTSLSNVNVGESTIWSVNSLTHRADCGYKHAIVWTLKSTDEGNRWVTTNITDDRLKKFPIPPQIMQLVDQTHNENPVKRQ